MGHVTRRRLPLVPASFFGMVLGLGGLANGWRVAGRLYGAPDWIGHAFALAATATWLTWAVFYGLKWLLAREAAEAELAHPVQSFFVALVPVATMLVGVVLAPLVPDLGYPIAMAGVAAEIAVAIWAAGLLWQGGRAADEVTPILYMPSVGGGFVCALACGAYGYQEAGMLLFGAGLISYLALESVILQRLMTHSLPTPLRATLGIHLAPPAVGTVAYLSLTEGAPDRFVQILFGYALLQALVMIRLVPWLREQAFSPAAWAYSFGVSALPLGAMRLVERGATGPIAHLALPGFIAANLIIGWIALRTLHLAVTGRLLPR